MTATVTINPDALKQFRPRNDSFCLIIPASRRTTFRIGSAESYVSSQICELPSDASIDDILLCMDLVPVDADVLAVCPGVFVTSPSNDALAARRLSIMPCGSTPTTDQHVAYFARVTEESDPERQDRFCTKVFDGLEQAATIHLADDRACLSAEFVLSSSYEWHQQAGYIDQGQQQLAPPGEISATPCDISHFDPRRRLQLTGSLGVSGAPIVHRADRPGLDRRQADLFSALNAIRNEYVSLKVEQGVIVDCRPLGSTSIGAAKALNRLFETEPAYTLVWEFGIGCNEVINPQPGNCGMNEMFGGNNGTLHIGLGLTPTTEFAITLPCQRTRAIDPSGRPIFGPQPRRLNRRRSASCGCT